MTTPMFEMPDPPESFVGAGSGLAPFWLLATGWRYWPLEDRQLVFDAIDTAVSGFDPGQPIVVMEGDCPFGGVDRYARDWARLNHPRVRVETHNPERFGSGPERFTKRNAHMVRLLDERRRAGGQVAWLGFPGPERPGGTWDCMRRLIIDAGIPGSVLPYPRELWVQRQQERRERLAERRGRGGPQPVRRVPSEGGWSQ